MTATNAPADLARSYLAAFLSPAEADALSRQALDEAGRDTDAVPVLSVAHGLLTSRVRVSDGVAADVLVEDVGLSPGEAARVLGVDEVEVVDAVATAMAIAEELATDHEPPSDEAPPDEPPSDEAPPDVAAPDDDPPQEVAPEPGAPEPVTYVFDTEEVEPYEPSGDALPEVEGGGRGRTLTVIIGVLILVAVALAFVTGGEGGETQPDTAPAASTVTVTAAGTALPADDGGPGADQQVFAPEDPVVFWFEYEPLDGDARVELVLSRDGQELINPDFPLPARRTDSHVTLPRAVTEEPGSYVVRLLRDGRELTERSFEVARQ